MSSGKENEQVLGLCNPSTPTTRTPLADVGNNRITQNTTPVFLKRAQYSQVTPFSTPLSTTPKRPVARVSSVSRCITESGDVPLNSLIYKKVLGIISEKEQEFKDQLTEKESVITNLQQQLELLTIPQIKISHEEDSLKTDGLDTSSGPPTTDVTKALTTNLDCLNISGIKEVSSTYPITSDGWNLSFDILPLLDSVGSLELKPIDLTESGSSKLTTPSIVSPKPGSSPAQTLSQTPKSCRDISVENPSLPKSQSDASQMTELVVTIETGVGSASVVTTDAETLTNPIQVSSTLQNTTPVKKCNQETMVSPVKSISIGQNTSPRKVHAVATCTERACEDRETMVTPVKCSSVSTSPSGMPSEETCSTPQPRRHDIAVGTSPFCRSLPRPSEINFSTMKVKDMSLQLETATISNTLLRDELNALQHDKQSMYKKVTITDSKLKEYEEEKKRLQEEISRRVYQAKLEMNKQLEDLMEEQANFLSQISNLKSEIKMRDIQQEATKEAHEKQIEELNCELANLRKDLVTAYQQKKQQIEALKAEYTATDYRPHYERARQEVTNLRAQLDMFTGFKVEMRQAKSLQREAADIINARAKEVREKMATVNQHLTQLKQWEEQHKEWSAKITQNDTEMSQAKSELEACRKTINDLKKNITDSKELTAQLQTKLQSAEERQKVHFVESEGLKATVSLGQNENEKSKETIKNLSTELEELRKVLNSTTNARRSESEQLTKVTQDCERYKRMGDMQRSSLIALRSVAKKSEELEKELNALRKQHESLTEEWNLLQSKSTETQSQLQNITEENVQLKSEVSLLQNELESLDSHFQGESEKKAEEEKAAREGIKNLGDLIIQLRNQLTSCRTNWLDEENSTDEEKTGSKLSQPVLLSAGEKDKSRKSGRKSIICSVMKALSGGVDSPTVDLDAPPSSFLDIVSEPRPQPSAEEEALVGSSSRARGKGLAEAGTLRTDLEDVEGMVEAVLKDVTTLTGEVFAVIESLKRQMCNSGAMSEQVTQLKAERDETMRQLQLARANEAQLSDCLQELKNAGTEESGSKEVAELEQMVAEKNMKIRTLEAMYEKALSHFRATGKLTMEDIGIAQENISLTMEVTELREKVNKHEATLSRYSNQKKKLHLNWQTAEEELKKLEQLVETVRHVLCEHESEIRASWRETRRLERLGMFASYDDTASLLKNNPR